MSKLERYLSYKDSGVEWLGEIPEEWEVKKLKYIINLVSGFPFRSQKFDEFEGYNVIRIGDIKDTINIDKCMKSLEKDIHRSTKINKFDTLIALSGATTGKSCFIDNEIENAYINQRIAKFNYKNSFLYYCISNEKFKKDILLGADGSAQENVSNSTIENMSIPFPPKQEQIKIASFLDTKTEQLDKAIKQKEQLIELLKERRQILINDAVTKGIDKTVTLKDSGVEWIGKIPEHWEVKKLRYLGKTQNGISAGAEYFGSGFPFVNYSDVYKNVELPKQISGLANSSKEDRNTYSICKGDVFFTRTSETAVEIGFSSTCMETFNNAIFSGFLIRFRPNKKLYEGYSKFYFRSSIHRAYFVKEMNLVIRASLSQELLKNLPVILPPLEDQIEISNYIEKNNQKIDKVINLQQKQITKLKEYKTTLIDSVVTGTMRVCDD